MLRDKNIFGEGGTVKSLFERIEKHKKVLYNIALNKLTKNEEITDDQQKKAQPNDKDDKLPATA